MLKLLIAGICAVLGVGLIVTQVILDMNILQPVGVFGTLFSGIALGILGGEVLS